MKRQALLVIAVVLLGVLMLAGCDLRRILGRSGELEVDPTTEVVLGEQTRILDDAALASLSAVSPDGSVFTFAAGDPAVDAVQPGNVLVLGVSEHSPYGLLRKVEQVTSSGNELIVTTSQASIEDAVQEGDLQISYDLLPEAATEMIPAHSGITFRNASAGADPAASLGHTFVVDLRCVPLDLDGDPGNGEQQITIDGTLEFTLGFRLDIKVHWFKLQKVEFAVFAGESVSLQATGDFEATIEERIELGSIRFSTIRFMAGPLPVWITPKVVLWAGLDGSVAAELSTSLTQGASVEPYIRWTRADGWDSGIDFINDGCNFQPPEAAASCSAKVYAGPELQMLLYGVAGPLLGAEAYLDFGITASSVDGFHSALYWGLLVNIGASLSAIGDLEDIRVPVLEHRDLIWQFEYVVVDDDYGYQDDPGDGSALAVLYTTPPDGAVNVDPAAPIGICFDDTVSPASVNSVSVEVIAQPDGVPLCGTFVLSRTSEPGTALLEFRPDGGSFPTSSEILVVMTSNDGLLDDGGNSLSDTYTFSFTTGQPRHIILGFQDDLAAYTISGTGNAAVVEYPFFGIPAIERTHGLVISSCITGLWDGIWDDASRDTFDTSTLSCAGVTVPAGVSELVFDCYLVFDSVEEPPDPHVEFTIHGPAGSVTVFPFAEPPDWETCAWVNFGDGCWWVRADLETASVGLDGVCEPGDQVTFTVTVGDGFSYSSYQDALLLLDAVRFE